MRMLAESGARQNYNLGDVIPAGRNGLHIPRLPVDGGSGADRHYRVPRKAPTLRETLAPWAETETARFGRLRFSICDAHSET
ncbi:hypothetical protein V1478_005454, partial [Vespula squamosa]